MSFGVVGWLVIIAVVLWIVVKRRRQQESSPGGRVDASLDAWITEFVSRAVSKRSTSLDIEAIEASISGSPEPEVVSRVEGLVRGVEVSYEKLVAEPGAPASAEVRVTVRFEDGTTEDGSRRALLSEVAPSVADELARTGAVRAFRSWHFPWAR